MTVCLWWQDNITKKTLMKSPGQEQKLQTVLLVLSTVLHTECSSWQLPGSCTSGPQSPQRKQDQKHPTPFLTKKMSINTCMCMQCFVRTDQLYRILTNMFSMVMRWIRATNRVIMHWESHSCQCSDHWAYDHLHWCVDCLLTCTLMFAVRPLVRSTRNTSPSLFS